MTDRDSLLAAIREHPEEDTPRLVYADWLDEHGEAERAGFIRAQCELARTPDCPFPRARSTGGPPRSPHIRHVIEVGAKKEPCGFCPVCVLRKREQEAWERHHDVWFPKPVEPSIVCLRHDSNVVVPSFAVRRGFVDEIRVPDLAALMGTPCDQCGGRGYELIPTFEPVRETTCGACGGRLVDRGDTPAGPGAKWCRQCWATTSPRHNGYRQGDRCPHCSGAGRVGGCRDLLRREPVTRVRVTDREPLREDERDGGDRYRWVCNDDSPFGLPESIYSHLRDYTTEAAWTGVVKDYPTRDAAHAALSAAVLRWARGPG
jgi:uncharacterized protein (TIGR02996 family)